MQWLRSSIFQFQVEVQNLQSFQNVYHDAGKRTKRELAHMLLCEIGWTPQHTPKFESFKQYIIRRTTLYHRDKSNRLCILTDGSDSHWSRIMNQVTRNQFSTPHAYQDHEPLNFHTRRF